MEAQTKQKAEDLIKGLAKEASQEALAEYRKEQEARTKELDASIEKRFAVAATKAAQDEALKDKGVGISRIIRALAAGRGSAVKAAEFAEAHEFGEGVVKALSTAPNSGGGYIVPPSYSAELIDLLYNRVCVRKLGAQSIPMPNGTLTMPKLNSGVTAQYIGENASVNAQQQTFGVVTLSWKKLRATVPYSNDLLLYSNPKVDDVVKNDLVNAFAVAEDAAFLRGTGSGTSPTGIDTLIPTSSPNHSIPVTDPTGGDLTDTIADLYRMPRLLEEANIPMIKVGWVFSPRTKYFLMGLRDNTGNFYFLDEMRRGTLLGYPFCSTNQVPSNLGGTSDASVIYFGDWNDAIIGESTTLQLDVSDLASYKDDGGNLVSAFDLDQSVVRGIARHDFNVRRVSSFAKLTGLKWGL